MLAKFSYIAIPNTTSNLITDIKALLLSNNKQNTFIHVNAVAEMNVKIAEQYGLDRTVCKYSGLLHDISAVISKKDMLSYATDNGWYIDEAEQKYPVLLHQRISKIVAQEDFGITDERILSAIEYHSTLKAEPSFYDMALFVADKLVWQESAEVPVCEAPFYSLVSNALNQSLEAASLAYMDYIVEHNMIYHPHKWFEEGRLFLHNKVTQ